MHDRTVNLKKSDYRISTSIDQFDLWEQVRDVDADFEKTPTLLCIRGRGTFHKSEKDHVITIKILSSNEETVRNLVCTDPEGFSEVRSVLMIHSYEIVDYKPTAREVLISRGFEVNIRGSYGYAALGGSPPKIYRGNSYYSILRQVDADTPKP